MSFLDNFRNDFTTSDNAKSDELLTRYFRNDYNSTKKAILEVCDKLKYTIVNVNDDYKEFLISSSRSEIIISVIAVGYYEMAVDLKINTKYLISMGRGLQEIGKFYAELEKSLNMIRKGKLI
jgi:hypothetical protein